MMKVLGLTLVVILNVLFCNANEFFLDDQKIPDHVFKEMAPMKTPEERAVVLNHFINQFKENKTKYYENMPFFYRKVYGGAEPILRHDEIEKPRKLQWDPNHLAEIEKLPFLKRVWARTKHPQECQKCNGMEEYKRLIDEKMVEKIRNITLQEEQLRHGKNHEKCHSRGNCDSHGDETVEAAVVYEDVDTNEEKKREEEIRNEQKRKEAIEKLNYHFYRRAVMESKLTGEAPEKIFKEYHRMGPQELQKRFHAVYQKYLEMRRRMQEYYKNKETTKPQEGAAPQMNAEAYARYLKELHEKKVKEAEENKKMEEQKRMEEERKRQQQAIEQQKHREVYQKYIAEQRRAKEQKDKEDEYKRQEIINMDKQLAEIKVLKENIAKEIDRTKREGDAKDLESLEKLESELLQWEQKVKSDKELKLQTLDVIASKINAVRDRLLAELKHDLVHGNHRNEQSFENAKKRYLHVKENFNDQINKVRDGLLKKDESEEYDSDVYKDGEDESQEEDYNTHERQLMEIDEIKNHLTQELDKAKKEGKHIKDIYQLEGARKQLEDWEEKVKNDNVLHFEKANIVNRKINEFKGFLNSYKVYKYSTTPAPQQ